MSETPRTNTIAPVGYARAQDLLLYREVWAGYSNKPADENGHPPVALYTQDQVNAMLTAERERADRAKAEGIEEGMRRAAEIAKQQNDVHAENLRMGKGTWPQKDYIRDEIWHQWEGQEQASRWIANDILKEAGE